MEKGYIMTEETAFKKFRRKCVKGILAGVYHIFYKLQYQNGIYFYFIAMI